MLGFISSFGLLSYLSYEDHPYLTVLFFQAAALFTLVVIIAINLAVGILPHVDNFAHIGGFLSGFLLGFVFLVRPQFGWVPRRNQPLDTRIKSKYKVYQYVMWIIALLLLIAGWVCLPNLQPKTDQNHSFSLKKSPLLSNPQPKMDQNRIFSLKTLFSRNLQPKIGSKSLLFIKNVERCLQVRDWVSGAV